jgi:hypothetical protein
MEKNAVLLQTNPNECGRRDKRQDEDRSSDRFNIHNGGKAGKIFPEPKKKI